MFLSIIIPAYNEQERLKVTLEKVSLYLDIKQYESEVIVVDDGSTDDTVKVALSSKLNTSGRLTILQNEGNRGKGFSVRRAILAARGDYILFSDADLSTPIEEVEKLFKQIEVGADIVIGSRSIEGAQVQVHQPFYREWMGRLFNFFVQLFVLKGFIDTQCGFKLLRASPAKDIATFLKIDGFSFDVELMYLATKKNYRIKETPVIWINSPNSRVNPIFDSYKMLKDLLTIKQLHRED